MRIAAAALTVFALTSTAMADTVPTDSDGGSVAAIPAHDARAACDGGLTSVLFGRGPHDLDDCVRAEGAAVYRLVFKMDWGNIPAPYRRDCIASAGDGNPALFLRS